MHRLIAALLLLLLTGCAGPQTPQPVPTIQPPIPQPPTPITIQAVNQSSCDPAQFLNQTTQITNQLSRDVSPYWPQVAGVQVVVGGDSTNVIYLVNDITTAPGYAPNDLGFHVAGKYLAYAGYLNAPVPMWREEMSHEIIEMLIDPTGNGNEICDPVEQYGGYTPGTIQGGGFIYFGQWPILANFVLPAYYVGQAGPKDFVGALANMTAPK